ncbi:hypothetical protein [Sporichthya sp.]|uniref:hypothetical protein n=1 Tax=Sporichthya sp. TaxID=65475 RepID=UPI00181324DF|nr:hypothetical protein [Sporichthya sp.]MBA3742325.1 hypothetical protein [Sporichthya sp.]
MKRVVLLDNEAVQALMALDHPRHRRALAFLEVVAGRRKKAVPLEVVVPTAVRVESGWDRREPRSALINRLRIRDAELGGSAADEAATLVETYGMSVADAHLGAVIADRHEGAAITVITSGPGEVAAVAGSAAVIVVRL